MPEENPYPFTLQIPVDRQLHMDLVIAAFKLGITSAEFRRQALAFAVRSDRFKKHMEKVYAKAR